MVLKMAIPKNRKSTILPGMRGIDAAKEMTLKGNILQVFTIVFSETKSFVNHKSQLDGQNKKCIQMAELAKQDHTYHFSKEELKRYQGQWYLTLNKSGKKRAYATSTRFSSCSLSQKPSSPRVRRTGCRTNFSTTI